MSNLNESTKKKKEAEEALGATHPDESQFSQFYWARHRPARLLFHIPLLLTSRDYRTYRFFKISEKKRMKKAEKWAKKFSSDTKWSQVTIDQVVGRDSEVSLLIDAVDYHILRIQDKDPQFARMYSTPPPKVFILESDPGWGKKILARAIQKEAQERGAKEGIKVSPETLKSSDVSSWLMGVSEKQLESKMNALFATPSVIFIDNAQAFAEKPQSIGSDIERESRRISEALERSLERLKDNPIRSITILSTNNFASMPETIRLIAERINLNGMKEEHLIEICRRRCRESGINVDPEKLYHALSQTLRMVGKSDTTPSDINKAFILATNKVQAPYREALRNRLDGAAFTEPPKPTVDDFISIAPDIAAYTEEEVSTMVKETRQFTKPTERYRDVGGLHDVLGRVITEIKCALDPDLAKQLGYEPPIGFLFYGPPGSGKTLLAKAIAGEEGAKVRVVSGSEVYQKEVGETERNIRSIFSEARKEAPSIIIWDEIDAVAVTRGSRSGDPVHAAATTILLSELEGLKSGVGRVLFIGITNRRDIIDEALLNRLLSVEFTYPKNAQERREVLEVHLRKTAKFLSKDATIDKIMRIFLQRTFSPRVVSYTIRSAVAERTKEVVACREMLNALRDHDKDKISIIRGNYGEQLLYIEDTAKKEDVTLKEMYSRIAASAENPMSYPLTLQHLERVFNLAVKSEEFEELKEMQRIYRSIESEIGKSYGLATAEGGDEQRGLIIVVESEIFPRSNRAENLLVLGTVSDSVKESVKVAAEFLRKYYPRIDGYDIDVHIITPAEGAAREELKLWGPSAGMAIATSIASAIWLIPLSPNVCMTGKIELKNGLAGLVGGIHPKKGSGKIDIAADEQFKAVIIPTLGYGKLVKDYQEYVDAIRARGTEIIGGKDFFDYLSVASGLSNAAILKKLGILPVKSKSKPKPAQSPVEGEYCKVDYSKTPTEQEYAQHVATLADQVIPKIKSLHTGRDPDAEITFMLERGLSSPAATAGKTVYLNMDHFDRIAKVYGSREADDGAVIHETDHAILYAPRYDKTTAWLIEGVADYVRDKLGYERETKGTIKGSYPHFEEGKATSDYQVTADFLMFLEKLHPTIVEDLASELVENTYREETFEKLLGKPLQNLIETYSDRKKNSIG